ncbi:hypothetical protein C8R47DRAFT_1221143 [Mycena vitilis]|nr:hypothetical protein C8R47DRAFT_1221143 [Mycena vitilis]
MTCRGPQFFGALDNHPDLSPPVIFQLGSTIRASVPPSLHHPLNISIDLEAYFETEGFGCAAPIPLDEAFAPQIGRWRMIALRIRGFDQNWDEETDYWYDGDHRLESLFAKAPRVRSLRVDILPLLETPIPLRTLQTLDLDYGRQSMWRDLRHPEFRQLFGSLSSLTTLVIRNFRAQTYRDIKPIDARTIPPRTT